MVVTWEQGNKLEGRLSFESLVSDLSAQFVQVSSSDVDRAINDAFRRIVGFFQCDRAGLLTVQPEIGRAAVTHAFYADGIPEVSGDINLAEMFPSAYESVVLKGQTHQMVRVDDLSPDATLDAKSWRALGNRSALHIPIRSAGGIRHIMAMNMVREERNWPEEYIPRLQLLGEVFVNALERKRADEVLRQSEARLSLAADSADAGLWELDARSRCFWGTPKAYELYGVEYGVTVTLGALLDLVHEEDRERVRAEVQQTLERGADFRSEYRIVRPDGLIRWIAARGRLHQCEDMSPHRMTGISIDITARKESELALQAAHEEIQRLRERLQQENVYLRQEVKCRSDHSPIVGQSRALRKVLYQIEQVAPTNAAVLLEGETGTGKELVAHAIHEASSRREHSMVCVNCGAIPGPLIESELFGREKGAYTGALARQIGRFELADDSTIFLDEVSELALELQVKLLRVLQEQTIERLGSPRSIKVNVRIIAATNHNLEAAVSEGRFRQDLFYRLSVFPIRVPPLRERKDDIPLLAWAFVEEFNKAMGKGVDSIARESMEAMVAYPWMGNVRELRNLIERAMILATGPCLSVELPSATNVETGATSLRMNDVESAHICSVLNLTNGRIRGKSGAAELLGLNPSTPESRMLKLGIRREVR